MESKQSEVKQIATQLLSGMLANPHLYQTLSDQLGRGPQEQDLVTAAIEMAESLIEKIEKKLN